MRNSPCYTRYTLSMLYGIGTLHWHLSQIIKWLRGNSWILFKVQALPSCSRDSKLNEDCLWRESLLTGRLEQWRGERNSQGEIKPSNKRVNTVVDPSMHRTNSHDIKLRLVNLYIFLIKTKTNNPTNHNLFLNPIWLTHSLGHSSFKHVYSNLNLSLNVKKFH